MKLIAIEKLCKLEKEKKKKTMNYKNCNIRLEN